MPTPPNTVAQLSHAMVMSLRPAPAAAPLERENWTFVGWSPTLPPESTTLAAVTSWPSSDTNLKSQGSWGADEISLARKRGRR